MHAMRPSLLDPLFAPVTVLDGVGPRLAGVMAKLLPPPEGMDEPRVVSLLFHLPHSLIDRRNRPGIAFAPEGAIVTLQVRIDRHQPPPRGNRSAPYRVFADDETGEIALTFFHVKGNYLEKALPVGETMLVSGRMEWFNGRPSMVHPDHMVRASEAESLPLVEPVYPLTAGLPPKVLRRAVTGALSRLPELPEWDDAPLKAKQGWPDFGEALARLHNPQAALDLEPDAVSRRRVAYDELLAGQLALALVRKRMKRAAGHARTGDGSRQAKIRAAFPYPLTGAQERSLAEIATDMAAPERMLRLLQGDVGSGKTIVALLAMAIAAEAGFQSALMAPTEVLARQHATTIAPLALAAGLRTELLTGREKGTERTRILGGVAEGRIDILIGTHALIQEGVEWRRLGLAVIDEQHRFGVHQRLALSDKGDAPDVLVMTATPIPRTLVLTAYGDMDVSRLDEKPAFRQKITTATVPLDRLAEVVDRIAAAVEEGQKVYWICPLVEESDEFPATAAEDRHAALAKVFGDKVGLAHGRLKAAEKDAAMAGFREGRTRILVATTVVEVGVDVPDATIIVIEHAERFGLSQLHQLRGRVGRGDKPSTCLLLYKAPLGETAHARLAIMRETDDGFRIAEEDLRLRGEGDVLGSRQSGLAAFRVADLEAHGDLLETARKDARLIAETDPELSTPRGQALRLLLYLFEKDAAVRLLRAG